MTRFLVVFVVFGCAAQPEGIPKEAKPAGSSESAIIGGSDASISDFPWQVSLRQRGGHICGGSIIDRSWILTAAHCVEGASATSLSIEAGVSRRSELGPVIGVQRVIVFPTYREPSRGGDAALLQLASPLTFSSTIAPIPLATPEAEAAGIARPGATATVSGWGTLRAGGSSPDRLQAVDVPIVSLADARRAYGSLTNDQLPAGRLGVGGVDSCQGDSGGPLVVRSGSSATLVGIVSWGTGCGDARYPGMYARVSSFAAWVQAESGVGEPNPLPDPLPDPDIEEPESVEPGTHSATGSLATNAVAQLGPFPVAGGGSIRAVLGGGSGDPDLYVRFGAPPTTSEYGCRSWRTGPDEECVLAAPSGGGDAYVMVHGYAAGRFELEVSWTEGGTTSAPAPTLANASGSLAAGATDRFEPISVRPGSRFVAQLSGTGDADLYVRWNDAPDATHYDCRPYRSDANESCELTVPATASTAHVMVDGYTASTYVMELEYVAP